ncbi:hypothetical protein DMA11_24295 [Marinilabiliaceae bacterium JC017]|nr:hypothetical protein DMA11_24295 [Marinilabiliaceae bacterium JC017]
MKHTIYFLIIALTVILSSCANNNRALFMKLESIDGLGEKGIMYINGYIIGNVDNIKITAKGNFLIKLNLVDSIKLPIDTRFEIKQQDIFGTKRIEVVLGTDTQFLSNGDTIIGITPIKNSKLDKFIDSIENTFEKALENNSQDSLLIELRRLNENLEKLNQ